MEKPRHILIVDDEEANRKLLQRMLSKMGYESELAADGLEALAKLKLGVDLVLLDVIMPGMDGFAVSRRIRESEDFCDIPVIMVTGLVGIEDRLRAVEAGANDFIAKPLDITELRVRLNSQLKLKSAQDTLKRHQAQLEEQVAKRTVDLRKALCEMVEAQRKTQEAHLDTIQRLAVAAEYKDEGTAAHIHRMAHYCDFLASALSLPPDEQELVLYASPMHDVGKIGIPDAILLKPGKLTEEEWEVMKQHTIIGARILSGSSSKPLQTGEVIALSHHEKWDGSGYPNGLVGEDIPLWGRISAIADVFDALTTRRPYKKAFPNKKALNIMKEERGRHFDPEILDLFLENVPSIVAIQKKYRQKDEAIVQEYDFRSN